jgi:hypothetical protein
MKNVARQLLEYVLKQAAADGSVLEVYLHVQIRYFFDMYHILKVSCC